MAAPQLNFLAKQLFLKQVLSSSKKHYRCFLKSLVINNKFLSVANKHKVYKVYIYLEDKIELAFGSYEERITDSSKSTFETACCMLKLLKPPSTYFWCGFGLNEHNFLTLTQNITGKSGFWFCNNEEGLAALKHVWTFADEIGCSVKLLEQIDEVRSKSFDELEVVDIKSTEQLNTALKYPSKQLQLNFSSEFDCKDESEEMSLNKNCEIQIVILQFENVENTKQISLVVQKVHSVCSQLKKLKILHEVEFDPDCWEFNDLQNEFLTSHELFIKTVEMARNLKLPIIVEVDFCNKWDAYEIDFPENWQQELKKNDGLKTIEIEEEPENEDGSGQINFVSNVIDNVINSTFKAYLSYCYNLSTKK